MRFVIGQTERQRLALLTYLVPPFTTSIARGTSRLSDVQRRYARALAPFPAGADGGAAMDQGEDGDDEEEGLAQRLLTAARGISRASRETGACPFQNHLHPSIHINARRLSSYPLPFPPTYRPKPTVVAEDHEEFRRTLELLGDLLEEERGERHGPALPPHSSREEWSRVLVFRARRHLERDFFSHMQVRATCVWGGYTR